MALSEKTQAFIKKAVETGIPFCKRTGVELVECETGYVKMKIPFEPNINHVGIMYAGALFTLAEVPGGALFMTAFDGKKYYPIVKDMKIRFRRPAKTDITVEVRMSAERVAEIQAEAEEKGKADYSWNCELKDESGEVVALTENLYQIRRFGL
jgi:acyl-coenzyme A thioesterase PaaI-like protein